jgi:hypothetical protein
MLSAHGPSRALPSWFTAWTSSSSPATPATPVLGLGAVPLKREPNTARSRRLAMHSDADRARRSAAHGLSFIGESRTVFAARSP